MIAFKKIFVKAALVWDWADGGVGRRGRSVGGFWLSLTLVASLAPELACAKDPEQAKSLNDAIAKAKSGDVIRLDAGTYRGPIKLPPGVSLRGAGAGKTIVDARGASDGISIDGGSKARISDLSVLGASNANISVVKARTPVVSGVRSVGGGIGIRFNEVESGIIENAICDQNRYGVVVRGGFRNAVVNSTLARNISVGLSLPMGDRPVVFNTVVADSPTCLYVGEKVSTPAIDHNFYQGQVIAKMAGQSGKRSVDEWRSMSGLDRHSVSGSLVFRNPREGDFSPLGTAPWSQERSPLSDWGVAEFQGVKAPSVDLLGNPRAGIPDLGAYETVLKPSRRADAVVKVTDGEGLTSAGVFDADDRLVCYLFQNAPLGKGEYRFWLPPQSIWGERISGGTYQLRTIESRLDWEYLGHIGDTGADFPPSHTASAWPSRVVFDNAGHVLISQGWSEDDTNLRAYRVADGCIDWTFEGSLAARGLTCASNGVVLMARDAEKKIKLNRFEAKTGRLLDGEGFRGGQVMVDVEAPSTELAELDGSLYLSLAERNEVVATAPGKTVFNRSIKIKSPRSLAADQLRKVLWLISADASVIGLDPQGKRVSEIAIKAPAALAARDGLVAIASRESGKVHFFETKDLAHPKPIRSLGRGDGPFGPVLADRFSFQAAPGFQPNAVSLALGPAGELAVIDWNRLLVFDANQRLLWSALGVFGNGMIASHALPGRLYDQNGRRTFLLDDQTGTWKPEAYWDVPGAAGTLLGDFVVDGKVHAAFLEETRPGKPLGLYRQEGFVWRKVSTLAKRNNQGAEEGIGFPRFNDMASNGDVLMFGPTDSAWLGRLPWERGAGGAPSYRPDSRTFLPKPPMLVSPYTHKPEQGKTMYYAQFPDGAGVAEVILPSSGGTGLSNTAGTDLYGVGKNGGVRWVHPFSQKRGIVGLTVLGGIAITGVTETSEIVAVNRDGLSLVGFAPAARTHYEGYFLDHGGAVSSYRAKDGRHYALIADNFNGRIHWYRLKNEDTIRTSSMDFRVSAAVAASIALETKTPTPSTEPPVLRIPKLSADLPIDGDFEKWRKLGIAPQVVITPESATGGIDGPGDCSALVRLAYFKDALYVQAIQFDDVVTMHQPVAFHYKQECFEMCINGFMPGFKFDVAKTTDAGPMIIRQRYFAANMEGVLDKQHAPLVIKVLPDSSKVTERDIIESAFGVDLSRAKAIVTEFKLPIDKVTYKPDPAAIFPLKSGQTFWLGFMIDDNDDPGTDAQHFIPWPPSFGVFSSPETGARAVLE